MHVLTILLFVLVTGQSKAATISGVEFSGWTTIDAPGGSDLDLRTLGDLYVFVPNGLFVDQVTFVAEIAISFETGVSLNEPLLCDGGCDLQSFAEDGDVVLKVLDPMGSVTLRAQNIVVSGEPIPEPSTRLLLALGLFGLALRRNTPRPDAPSALYGKPRPRSGRVASGEPRRFPASGD